MPDGPGDGECHLSCVGSGAAHRADSPTDAAMGVYRIFEDRSPNQFDVVGPDAEFNHVALDDQQQEQAITMPSRENRTLRPDCFISNHRPHPGVGMASAQYEKVVEAHSDLYYVEQIACTLNPSDKMELP